MDARFKITEMHMGINGQRLDKSQMAAMGYTLSTTEFHIVTEIPVGSPDGYYKVRKPLVCVQARVRLHVLLKRHE